MKEIEVGEYIRNKDGYIDKVIKIIEPDEYIPEKYYCCDILMASSYKSEIVKHSKQLIDLIEVGDIVNDCIVVGFGYECVNDNKEKSILVEGKYTKVNYALLDFEIKTILTKEQMEANCYEVGGEDGC